MELTEDARTPAWAVHPLPPEADGVASPTLFTYPFCHTPHPLCQMAAKEVVRYCHTTPALHPHEGKMFGVLVVESGGQRGYLRAFSGICNGSAHHEGFVPPVFDLQSGYFAEEEQRIVALTRLIGECADELRKQELKAARKAKSQALQTWAFQQFRMRNARGETKDLLEIFAKVKSPIPEEEYIQIRHSHHPDGEPNEQREERGIARTLPSREGGTQSEPNEQREERVGSPPAGAGECCAPKLLQFAYTHNLKPLCMAEFWVGPSQHSVEHERLSAGAEMRVEGNFYAPCQHKCHPILSFMLQGLDMEENPLVARCRERLPQVRIMHEDDDVMVVYKPAGLLSVPSREHAIPSLSRYLETIRPGCRLVHRLDMDTSGLLLAAKNARTAAELQSQFLRREVKKKYVAILDPDQLPQPDGTERPAHGLVSLPLSRNPFDSPRQAVNHRIGKPATTRYAFVDENRVELFPETGRTHQLRIHCAHPDGLNRPIKGDALYGTPSDRLYLHAERIGFTHPTTGQWMEFTCHEF